MTRDKAIEIQVVRSHGPGGASDAYALATAGHQIDTYVALGRLKLEESNSPFQRVEKIIGDTLEEAGQDFSSTAVKTIISKIYGANVRFVDLKDAHKLSILEAQESK